VKVDVPIVGYVGRRARRDAEADRDLAAAARPAALKAWWSEIKEWQRKDCLRYDTKSALIKPQYVMQKLYELTKGDAFITSDVGQHQMWVAQYYKFDKPRRWINSGGLGTMGFGLPAAMGVQLVNPARASSA
jgi:acetolactate synthase-1/2/3 large subunit